MVASPFVVHFILGGGVFLNLEFLSHLMKNQLYQTRLSIRGIQRNLSAIGKSSNIEKSLYPHRLRHTFATELLSKGAELSFISDELGHANIATTQVYARLPKREIIAQYRKYMG